VAESGDWRSRRGWTTAAYGLVAIGAILLLVLDRPGERPSVLTDVRAFVGDISASVMSAVSAPIRGVRSIFEGATDYWDPVEENRRLRQEVVELRQWRDLALSLRDKVQNYEAILNIPGVRAARPIGAWSVAESGGPFVHARLIDAGVAQGVREGHPVLTDQGLIGRVIIAGRHSSRVLLLTDLNSRIPVMTEDGEARALLTGDNSGAPRLEFINRDAVLEPGERIVTSGDAGLFPRGLPVGVAAPSGGQAWRVRLYTSGEPMDSVWVYPHDPIEPPEENPAPEETIPEAEPDSEDAPSAAEAPQEITSESEATEDAPQTAQAETESGQ